MKPVERITLSEKWKTFRLVMAILFAVLGIGCIVYGFTKTLGTSAGWQEISVSSSAEANCAGEFTLMYKLGASGQGITAEKKHLSDVYTNACVKAYQLFHQDMEFEDVHNIWYINRHPNELIRIDALLYDALKSCADADSRVMYLAPIAIQNRNLFLCREDSQAIQFDPTRNQELAEWYGQICAYASDENAVSVELLKDNTIILRVSEEYLAFSRENGDQPFLDLDWMTNAFIIDYLADCLTEEGLTNASIVSYDGYARNLYDGEESFSVIYRTRLNNTIYPAVTIEYSGPMSIVELRNFPLQEKDQFRYYEWDDGTVSAPYMTMEGRQPEVCSSLTGMAQEAGCAEIMLSLYPCYVTGEQDENAWRKLERGKITYLYALEDQLYTNVDKRLLRNIADSFRLAEK